MCRAYRYRLEYSGRRERGKGVIQICLWPASINLTNRFHVAVRLFSNRPQMTSKCGKNKEVAPEA